MSHRDDRDPEAELVDGVPVDSAEEILLRSARDLGHIDLVIMIDSAMRRGDIDDTKMRALLDSRRPGTRPLGAAYRVADPRSESAGETILRVFHEAMDLSVQPQVDLTDGTGRVIGRADLLVVGTTWVHEYDGAGHRDPGQHRNDLRRERRLAGTPYIRRGFTLDDLLNHAGVVMHELDRAAGRVHQAQRLRRWRRLVDHSLYSPSGRSRVANRWCRAMGAAEWSRTA